MLMRTMDLVRAQRYITVACIVSAAGILWSFISEKVDLPFRYPLHLFMPWVFASDFLVALVIAALTYLLYRKHEAGPRALALLYAVERAWLFMWLYVFSTTVIVAWVCVSLVWAFCFVQAIRGVNAFERAKRRQGDGATSIQSI